MRKTIGKLIRKYLYDKRLGDRRVVAIYRDGVKIWPTLSDTVYSCVLDVNEAAGGVDWAYWLHALDAVAKLGVSAECYMQLTAGGREYMLGGTFGNWYVAQYDGRATVVFGDNGPLWEKLQPGDVVTVQVRVPARELEVVRTPHESAEVSGLVDVPWLPGTGLSVRVDKGKKKQSAGVSFSVTGQPSGTVHIGGYAQKNGHCRGSYNGTAYARDMRVINGHVSAYHDACVGGDVRLNVWGDWYNSGSGYLRLLFPGIATTLRFKVSAVTRHG